MSVMAASNISTAYSMIALQTYVLQHIFILSYPIHFISKRR